MIKGAMDSEYPAYSNSDGDGVAVISSHLANDLKLDDDKNKNGNGDNGDGDGDGALKVIADWGSCSLACGGGI